MTKGELIKLLLDDKRPLDTKIDIYLECTNVEICTIGELTGITYDERYQKLTLDGKYEDLRI